jgi:hypothetical protein
MPDLAYHVETVAAVAAALLTGALASFIALLAVGCPS